MSNETDLLPKWSPDWTIILAKDQFHHSYTFWTMPILIFSPVQIIMGHPIPQMNQNTDDTIFKIVLATEMQIKGVKYDNYTILLTQ